MKSDYIANDDSYRLIHPDENILPQIFYRDEEYYIKVDMMYQNNEDVVCYQCIFGLMAVL